MNLLGPLAGQAGRKAESDIVAVEFMVLESIVENEIHHDLHAFTHGGYGDERMSGPFMGNHLYADPYFTGVFLKFCKLRIILLLRTGID
jgi:hypothetical protein